MKKTNTVVLAKKNDTDVVAVITNKPYTTVVLRNGNAATAVCDRKDGYDVEKGILVCLAKLAYGSNTVNDILKKFS